MQYVIKTAQGACPASVEPLGEHNHFQVQLGDGPAEVVEAVFLPDGSVSLRSQGRHTLVRPTATGAMVDGHFVAAEAIDLRAFAAVKSQGQAPALRGPRKILAPMAGRVARVLVQEGQAVAAGEGLVVVEAMKMENEVKAPKAGTVRLLTAREGVQVDLDQQLCHID